LFLAAILFLAPVVAHADLVPVNKDFETLNPVDTGALAGDGWLVFGNVFDPGFNYMYGYGPYPAPNAGGAFCNVATGQGGPAQGAQQMVVFSDYASLEHGNGNLVEANVFLEQMVGAADVGQTWVFRFDAKKGDILSPTTALAFIKTLQPPSYVMTNFITLDTSNLPITWGTFMLSIDIVPALEGQVLQIGFANTTTGYIPSGVLYDNINFAPQTPTHTQNTSWGRLKQLYR